MQGFQVVEGPQVEHQEPVIPPPFEESGEVDQRNGEEEEEDFMFLGVPQGYFLCMLFFPLIIQ